MILVRAWAIIALAIAHTPAEAAQFPEKAIRLLVPFAPDGNVDITPSLPSPGSGREGSG